MLGCFPARRRSRDSRTRPVGYGVPSSDLKFYYLCVRRVWCRGYPGLPLYPTWRTRRVCAMHSYTVMGQYIPTQYYVIALSICIMLIITKYSMPVAYTTKICTYTTCNITYLLMMSVCVCVLVRVAW